MSVARWLAALALLLAPASVRADEEPAPAGPANPPPLRRGLVDGVFVDEYFGLRYACEGLKKGLGFGGTNTLFTGVCGDGVEVEILIEEGATDADPAAALAAFKEAARKEGRRLLDLEEGAEPRPWVTHVQETLSGYRRHHGHAWYARGPQLFVLHAFVREQDETSGARLRAHLHRLEVGPPNDSWFLVHLAAVRAPRDPRSAAARLEAGIGYANNERYKNVPLGLRLMAEGLAGLRPGELTPEAHFRGAQALGLAQLTSGAREASIETWKRAIELAEKTAQPAALGANAWYNLACAYALLARLDEAFDALGRAFACPDAATATQLKAHANSDPDLEALRKDERWAKVTGQGG